MAATKSLYQINPETRITRVFYHLAQDVLALYGESILKNFGPMFESSFVVGHTLPEGTTENYELLVCRHPDPDGTRYATYPNGVSMVLTGAQFVRLEASQSIKSEIIPTPMPRKLRQSLNR